MIASFSRDAKPGSWHYPKMVAKWRKRQTVKDLKSGPKEPRSTILTKAEEATVVTFRPHMLLPRSALHPFLQRHSISGLPDVGGDKPERQKFERYPIVNFHIKITEV